MTIYSPCFNYSTNIFIEISSLKYMEIFYNMALLQKLSKIM